VTEAAYDLLDRAKTVTTYAVTGSGTVDTAATRVVNHCYDDAGDLRSMTGPTGASGFTSCPSLTVEPYVYTTATHTTTFEYDDAHRQTKLTDAASNVEETEYDANGAVVTQTDANGKDTTLTYNDRGERVTQVTPFDTGRSLTTKWEYDNLGNVKRLISPRAYDQAGGGPTFTDFVESYAYDALERLVTTTLPKASAETQAYTHNSYDANGRCGSTTRRRAGRQRAFPSTWCSPASSSTRAPCTGTTCPTASWRSY
jgi:YD repeat-containing protein